MPAAGGDVFLPGRTSVVGKGGGRKIMGMNPWVLAGAVGGGILLYFLYKRYRSTQQQADTGATGFDTSGGGTSGGSGLTGDSGIPPPSDFGVPPPDNLPPVPIIISLPDFPPWPEWPTAPGPDTGHSHPMIPGYTPYPGSIEDLSGAIPKVPTGQTIAARIPINPYRPPPVVTTVRVPNVIGLPPVVTRYPEPIATRLTNPTPPTYESRTPINVNVRPSSPYIPASVPHGGGLGGPK